MNTTPFAAEWDDRSEEKTSPPPAAYPRIAESDSQDGSGAPELNQQKAVAANGKFVFQSPQIGQLVETAKRFARSSASVLICGESGTGKEMFAKLLHSNSGRAEQRYVQVNCAALSESLLESEFFGHVKGAYTGADQPRVGRFEFANHGTILLDEISEIPVRLQSKLLRVLEESVFQKVGCNQDQAIDVRVIATSNRDLHQAVADGDFRGDLYHRLNVLHIDIPPLRDRLEDLPVLCEQFISLFRNESPVNVKKIAPAAIRKLAEFSWPGNVRQLRNTIHRVCILARSETITPDDIPEFPVFREKLPEWLLDLPIDEVEKQLIMMHLNRFGGNKTRAAKHLGITTRTLHNKLKSYQHPEPVAG